MLDEINFPDVKYGTKNKESYRELVEAEWSPFYGHFYWEIFIFSMSYAYAKGLIPKPVPGIGNMPANVFQQPTRDLMRALATDYTKNLNIIKDPKEYVKICEEFAYVGFDEILKTIRDKSNKHSEGVLMTMINEINEERI